MNEYRTNISVPTEHPALAGHFPGSPIVPGVVLLDLVLQTTEAWLRCPVHASRLGQAKFPAPLLPDQVAELVLRHEGNALEFRIECGARAIARGAFVIETAPNA